MSKNHPRNNANSDSKDNKYEINQTDPNNNLRRGMRSDFMSHLTITESNTTRDRYLDYTFLSHRAMIYSKKTKDPRKIKDYGFDLEQTLDINLNLLGKIPFNFDKKEQIEEIKTIISKIAEKNINRVQTREKIKTKRNEILNRKQVVENLKKKNEENEAIYETKEKEEKEKLNLRNKYIKVLNSGFKKVQAYIEILLCKNIMSVDTSKKRDVLAFVKENVHYHKEERLIESDIKKLSQQVSDIKKENQIYKEESLLYRNKTENKELIRVVEFYRRIIRALQTKIKILRNAFDNMTKTLNYLNLGDSKFFFSSFSRQFQHEKKRPKHNSL